MLDITFSINGRTVSPGELADTLEGMLQVATMEGVAEYARERLGELRCPEHHEAPRVIAAGPSLDELMLSVQGCCQALGRVCKGHDVNLRRPSWGATVRFRARVCKHALACMAAARTTE